MADRGRQEFDPLRVPLNGTHLVEANAGTGKTHSLASLFLRIVVDGEIDLAGIAMVTFTDAAARELRVRLRERLVELERALEAAPGAGQGDALVEELQRRVAAVPHARLRQRVRDALLRFDEMTVATIHGFCRRALERLGLPAGIGESEDPAPLRHALMEDFWRQRVLGGDAREATWALTLWGGPDDLARELAEAHIVPAAALDPAYDPQHYVGVSGALKGAYEQGRALYASGQLDATIAMLETATYRKEKPSKSPYDADGLARMREILATWFEAGDPLAWPLLAVDGLRPATALAWRNKVKTAKTWAPIPDPLTRWAETWFDAAGAHERLRVTRFRHEALAFVRAGMARLRAETGRITHDDLVADLDVALERPEAVATLARRYRLGVVDEFQDTDARQYAIFARIFRAGTDAGLFLVGDPKQAIYRFRGGDIHAYARAALEADAHWSLSGNWRADPGLIDAVNALFERPGAPHPFGVEFIGYTPSHLPATRTPKPSPWRSDSPMVLWHAAVPAADKAPNKEVMGEMAAQHTAAEIASVLAQARDAGIDAPSIAVLAATNDQLLEVANALTAWRIPALAVARDSVYASDAAADLEHLLRALLEGGERGFAAACARPLFGLPLAQVARANDADDADAWWALRDELRRCWQERGPLALLLRLLPEVAPRWIGEADGARRYADLLHVGELLADRRSRGEGMDDEVAWLSARRRAVAQRLPPARDELPRPLAQAGSVELLTVHRSKGLQFDIVFAPYLWGARNAPRADALRPVKFHAADGSLRVDLGSDELDRHQREHAAEELHEGLRHAYVALTRARHRCYTFWGRSTAMAKAPLAALLHPAQAPDGELPGPLDETEVEAGLARIAAASSGAIAIVPADPIPGPVAWQAPATLALAARAARRVVIPARRSLSFSALAAAGSADVADHDALDPGRSADPLAPTGPIAAYPRGPRVGECVHLALERIEFAQWPDGRCRAAFDAACRRFRYGEAEREVFTEWIGQALGTQLLPGLKLDGLAPTAYVRELEFHFSIDGNAQALGAALALDPRYQRDDAAIARLPSRLHGLMHGYIDLVLAHEGRWHVVDYKTNYLGGQQLDYAPEGLAQAVREGDYDLQYLIYLVAVHRHLRHRLGATYDPARQLGGALYLFVRGMTRDGRHGVHRDLPPLAVIEALDRAFDGAKSAA
jgi:exodeoxyribonuclease V beta subunit